MSKPKLLTKLKIGGDVYKVYWHAEAFTGEDEGCDAYTDRHNLEIHLNAEVSSDRLAECWLHEICHAIAYSFRMNLQEEAEEQLALQFGLGYAQALAGMIEFPEP